MQIFGPKSQVLPRWNKATDLLEIAAFSSAFIALLVCLLRWGWFSEQSEIILHMEKDRCKYTLTLYCICFLFFIFWLTAVNSLSLLRSFTKYRNKIQHTNFLFLLPCYSVYLFSPCTTHISSFFFFLNIYNNAISLWP